MPKKLKKEDKILYNGEYFKISGLTKDHIFLLPLERPDNKLIIEDRKAVEKEVFKKDGVGL